MKNIILKLLFVFIFSLATLSFLACDGKPTPAIPDSSLSNTYWKLIELDGQAVVTEEGQREMKFTLRQDNQLTGFAGCNSFFGGYVFDDKMLQFSKLAASRKFCAEAMDTENAFLNVFKNNAEYEIKGKELELLDERRKVLARFEAVYLQ